MFVMQWYLIQSAFSFYQQKTTFIFIVDYVLGFL